MKADKLLIISLVAIVVVKFVAAFPLDNTLIPGGTDVAHFLSNTWFVVTQGLMKWNNFWYAGYPFFRYYPPVAFLITGALAKVAGVLLAYKFMNDLFLVLSPLAFYAFMREFKLTKEKELVALLTFSFIPIFAYFLADGRFPTLINVFFSILYWKFLKRSLDTGKFFNLAIASMLLTLSLLTHHTTTFLFVMISSAWALIYKTNFGTIKKLASVGVLTLALTAWWSAPFFLETLTTDESGLFLRAVGDVYLGDITYRISTSVLQSPFYASSLEPILLIVLAAFMAVISLLALTRYKDKTTRDFILLALFILFMFFFVRYKRSVIFMAVPFSFIAAEGLSLINKKFRLIVSAFFVLLLVATYLLIRPQVFDFPEYPNIPNDGRVIFFPLGSAYTNSPNEMKNFYSVILSPMNDQENIRGWHDESQLIGKAAGEKSNYIDTVSHPLGTNKDDYYTLLKAGYINYVVVNKNSEEFVNYFKNPRFKQILNDSMFVAYEIVPKSTYVEFNGNSVESKVAKSGDTIEIDSSCQKGVAVIKESYHPSWKLAVNNYHPEISYDENGLIKFNSDFVGSCKITMKFEDPEYFSVFYLISIATLLLLLFNILILKKI
ncbi:MAG TPA: 6-pyruvoyl-tetrahydropterin synthase-related protein [archaeon]|nr:6-pyruvoyl-tetrahydropterin synthase-related protein [archaeon]